jgi:hypothetical protein
MSESGAFGGIVSRSVIVIDIGQEKKLNVRQLDPPSWRIAAVLNPYRCNILTFDCF